MTGMMMTTSGIRRAALAAAAAAASAAATATATATIAASSLGNTPPCFWVAIAASRATATETVTATASSRKITKSTTNIPAFMGGIAFVRSSSSGLMTASFSSSSSSSSTSRKLATEDVAREARSMGLFRQTPLIRSDRLTDLVGRDVYLKLDALQASGSFKDRGMAHLCQTLRSTRGTKRLISSSGGNAGLAVATIGRRLQMDVSVVVPSSTKELVIRKLEGLGADVTVHGSIWNEADVLARSQADADPSAEYISPYDNELLWTGHSTIIDEVLDELPIERRYSDHANDGHDGGDANVDEILPPSPPSFTPGAVIVSVGGGGLLCGIFEGLDRHGLHDTAVVAAETVGAACFGTAWSAPGGHRAKTVRLDRIDSIATSLGALEVTPVALERAICHISKHDQQEGAQENKGEGAQGEKGGGGEDRSDLVRSALCTDAEAVEACVQFAQDHRFLVEPACGAALAVLYSDRLRKEFFSLSYLQKMGQGPIIVEVCGGSGINVDLLSMWKKEYLSSSASSSTSSSTSSS